MIKRLAAALICWTTGTFTLQAQIVQFDFNIMGSGGYSARGRLAYEQSTAPATISYAYDSGAGSGSGLDSLTVSFYDPSSTLLGSFVDVLGGAVNYGYLNLHFNTSSYTFSGVFDFGQDNGNPGEYFWGGNVGSPSYLVTVPSYATLDSAAITAINVTAVPEPMECAMAVGLGLLGFAAYRRHQAA